MKKFFLILFVLSFTIYGKGIIERLDMSSGMHMAQIKVVKQMPSFSDILKSSSGDTLMGDTLVVGTTTYDWQGNNLSLRHIYYDSGAMAGYELAGVVWIWSDAPSPWNPDRHMYYWSGELGAAGPVQNDKRDGYGTIDYRTDGTAIVSEHYDNGSYYCSAVGYETSGPGFASFSMSECPQAPGSEVIWPRVGVDAKDNVIVVSRTNNASNEYGAIYYTKTTWGNWATDDWSAWMLLDTLGGGFHNFAASKQSSKFAVTYNFLALRGDTLNPLWAREGHLYYKESTDGGATWGSPVDLTALVPHSDIVCADRSHYPFYDTSDSLHVVFITTPLDTAADKSHYGMWFDAGQIWHWSSTTGLNPVALAPSILYFIPTSKWIYHDLFAMTSISQNTDDNNLYILWQYTPWNEKDSITGAPTGDLYVSRSRDGGITWSQPVDLTNTPNHSEIFPNLSPFFQGDTLRLAYLQDLRAGAYVFIDQGGDDTMPVDNPYVYMKVPIPPDGDAGVLSVDSPISNFGGYILKDWGDTIVPQSTVSYTGSVSADIQIRCKILLDEKDWAGDNLGVSFEVYSEKQDLTMNSGENTQVTFPAFVLPEVTPFNVDSLIYGAYFAKILHIEVSAAYLGDNNISNDVKMSDSINTVGYQQDFADGNGGYTGTGWILGNIKPADSTVVDTIGPGDNFGISKDNFVTVDDTLSWHTTSPYLDNADYELTMPETLTIYNPDNCWLSYRQWFQTEKGADGGNVKISLDHGATWTTLDSFYLNDDTILMGYPDSMNANNAAIPGEPAFSGDSIGGQPSKNWHKITFNLSKYTTGMTDSTLLIKWVFGSDNNATEDEGWGIDYVQVFGVYSGLVSGIPNNLRVANHIPELKTMKAYPNPMKGTGKVKFEIGKRCNTSINLYDVAGRRVKSIYNGMLNPGMHTIRWNAKKLPAGIYFIRVDTDNAHIVKKVVYLR